MDEKQISTGEVAKISGLTIRTLQHYDNIGVLPASGRTEGGRRFYTESDMIQLEHIIFYRGLGFSLNQSKRILAEPKTDKNADELLSAQKVMLYNQIYNIQNSIAAIEASQEIIGAGKRRHGRCWQLLCSHSAWLPFLSGGITNFQRNRQKFLGNIFRHWMM